MVSVAMMLGGAIVNALAFTGSNFLFSSLKGSDLEIERKRHDLALEKLTRDKNEWTKKRTKYLDAINERLRKEAHAKQTFVNVDHALRQYYEVTGLQYGLPDELRQENEPRLSDYYTPSDSQKTRELVWVLVGTTVVGVASYSILR